MSQPQRATICIFADGDCGESFRRCLDGVLRHTPQRDIEIRFGFDKSPHNFYHALGVLSPDGASPRHHKLPGDIERFFWNGPSGVKIQAWLGASALPRTRMARLLYHDCPLESDYTVALDGVCCVQSGWWEALQRQLEQGSDYIGQLTWHDYTPFQVEAIRSHSWYLGVPFDRREGRLGVWYVPWGFMAVRSDRIGEADFPNLDPSWHGDRERLCQEDELLGEMARQLGWKVANHSEHVQLKPI